MIAHDPRIRHHLLPLRQPPHLIRLTQVKPCNHSGDKGLGPEEDFYSSPGGETAWDAVGSFGYAVEGEVDYYAPTGVGGLED